MLRKWRHPLVQPVIPQTTSGPAFGPLVPAFYGEIYIYTGNLSLLRYYADLSGGTQYQLFDGYYNKIKNTNASPLSIQLYQTTNPIGITGGTAVSTYTVATNTENYFYYNGTTKTFTLY